MYVLKYIGPFLRMNTLNSENIEKQLFFLAKESVKFLVLNSRCGITVPSNELKAKNLPNIDNSIIHSISPLLCIYKKANPKLINIGGNLSFDYDALKKEITIESNGLMTLSLLELIDYYKKFKDIDSKKYSLSNLYLFLCRKQLEFYAANFRNIEGVFVDKKNVSRELADDFKFEEKNKKFKYSDQAFMMTAFYKYSLYDNGKCGEEYRNFSLDILNMFKEYKYELYLCSKEEICKLCFAFNLFYEYSKLPEANLIVLDLMEFLMEKDKDILPIDTELDLEQDFFVFINSMMLFHNTGILKFKDNAEEIYNKLLDLYEPERGIFIKPCDKKEITYSCIDIMAYLLSILYHSKLFGKSKDSNMIMIDVFKRQLIDSELVLSWPSSPELDDVERYKNFSSKAEDLLDEQDFRMASIPTPETSELPPVFIKNVTYNKKKEVFSQGKSTFDSSKNMFIFLLIIYLYKLSEEPDIEEGSV
ncbi:hypothetical protein M2651_12730 [Clostridium sp. SYSU_GA19001]|uniref:hypothetical protein n=1 Tax=Clostridium caldaquaticum TaxID=2940653 RepID=UPI002077382C|nr:hypothetical protein [Clostridium caldaquaticum]